MLVDAVTPEVLSLPGGAPAIRAFGRLLQVVSHGARLGLMVPVSLISGNLIGLPGEAAAEKRRIHASAPHARGAAAEVMAVAGDLADGRRGRPAARPAGGGGHGRPARGRAARSRRCRTPRPRGPRFGYVEHVAGANHANLLGPRYADAIVRGVEHVLAAAQSGSR